MNAAGDQALPGVTRIALEDKEVFLLGTAHVSLRSVEDVRRVVEQVQPDTVCVELCEARYHALVHRDAWKQMNVWRVVREKKALFLLVQLALNALYRKIGEQLGVQPGAEMIEGIRQAEAIDARLVLADRAVDITLKRVWGHLNFWNKCKMIVQLVGGIFAAEQVDAQLVEELKQQDQMETILKLFSEEFPEVKKRLIDERDVYLAQKIRSAPGARVVAIVGAGHVPGIARHIHATALLDPLNVVPPSSPVPKVLKWLVPAVIAVLLVLGFMQGDSRSGIESVYIWVFVNGILAAAGSALALAHPLTIVVTFLCAPLTSLNPMIAAGWVAGLVQIWVKKPTVSDLEDLPSAVTTIKGFWGNPVSKILLVVVLANLGSSLGTFISGGWIAARLM
jgi:pheromone shutdown-related protein TraB